MENRAPPASSLSPRAGNAGPSRAKPWHRRSYEEQAAETDRLKSDVDLFAVAELLDFEPTGEAGKMTHAGLGETIAIGPNKTTGHWCWTNNHGAAGTAIELIRRVDDCDFGTAIKKLRRLAVQIESAGGGRVKPEKIATDEGEAFWRDECWQTSFNAFLNVTRGLAAGTTTAPRFEGMWRADERKNAVFPYFELVRGDCLDIVGVERRNRAPVNGAQSFRSYSAGGSPGIWTSRIDVGADQALFVTESPIDAMSIYQLLPSSRQRASFMSIRAGVSDEAVRAFIRISHPSARVVAACDRDEVGEQYNAQIVRCAAAEARGCRIYSPPNGAKDWNEALIKLGA